MTPPVIVDPNMSFHVFVSFGIEGNMAECVSEKNWDNLESIAHWATIDPREIKRLVVILWMNHTITTSLTPAISPNSHISN